MIFQDGIPRGSYRLTVPFSWRGGKVRVFIVPAPGFVYVEPKGKAIVDRTGAVKRVRAPQRRHPLLFPPPAREKRVER